MKYSHNLFHNFCHLALCLDEQKYYRELERLKIAKPYGSFTAGGVGMMHYFSNVNSDGEGALDVAFVCLNMEKLKGKDAIYVAGVLVHEAVHVFQSMCEEISERDPSDEFEAYTIEKISKELMRSYVEQTA